jgi:transketolase
MGKAVALRDGKDETIISTGIMLLKSLEAADLLEKKDITSRIIHIHTIKPLDEKTIRRAAQETGAIVTVEDSSIIGGLGRAVAELVSESCPIPVIRVGVRDRFGQTGTMEELAVEYKMSSADIVRAAKEAIRRKRS